MWNESIPSLPSVLEHPERSIRLMWNRNFADWTNPLENVRKE
jgi:hypothetical protein